MNEGFFTKALEALRQRISRSGFMRSGAVTVVVIVMILTTLGLVWRAHTAGRIHKLRVVQVVADRTPVVRPGGQDLAQLSRSSFAAGMALEFTSATLAPGAGMGISQIRVAVREREDVPLLLTTPQENLKPDGSNGDFANFEIWTAPRSHAESDRGSRNILAGRAADNVSNGVMPDGGEVSATFPPTFTDRAGHVTDTGIDARVTALLSGRSVDLTITAKNTSTAAMPVTILWKPRFLAPAGGLSKLRLLPPASSAEVLSTRDKPTAQGVELGSKPVDLHFDHLKRSYLSNGPEAGLRNDEDGYTLHIIALSPAVRSLQVQAAPGGNFVSVVFSTAGSSADSDSNGMLEPGQILQWKVRLEITASTTSSPSAF